MNHKVETAEKPGSRPEAAPAHARTNQTAVSSDAIIEDGPAITSRQAWEALGSDPRYQPKSEQSGCSPASGPRLWMLNRKGLLRLTVVSS